MVALKAVGLDDKLFVHKSVKFHVVDDPLVVATAAFVKLGVLGLRPLGHVRSGPTAVLRVRGA